MEDAIGNAESEEPKSPHSHSHVHAETHKGFSGYVPLILSFIIYLAVALMMLYPLTLHMGSYAPGSGADTYQNLWNLWWVNYAVFHLHTNAFYTKILFWPIGGNLAYSTLAPLNGLIYAPFQALGTMFAYNIMLFMGFALSGLTMFILADYIIKNKYAAFVAGFAFTFSAMHIAQSYSHIHYINIEWIPLFLYFFLRIIDSHGKLLSRNSAINIIGMSATFALTTLMANIEQTLMLFFAWILLIIIYLFYKEKRKRILTPGFALSMVSFLVLAFIIGSWNFIPLINAVRQPGGLGTANYLNSAASNNAWSITPVGFFIPDYYNGLLYSSGVPNWVYNAAFAPDPVEKVGYIGFVVLALALFAVYRYRKQMLPWVIGTVVFAWLALGPAFGLYAVYHAIPGINIIREPGRFDLIVTMFTSILAAYGVKALSEEIGKTHERNHDNTMLLLAAAAIVVLMFVESNGMQLGKSPLAVTKISVPVLYSQIANLTGNFSVVGLPTLPEGSAPYLYPGEDTFYTSVTQKPLVGGYLGRRQNISSTLLLYNMPLAVEASFLASNGTAFYSSPVAQNYTNQTLLTMYNYGTEFVVLHKDAYTQQALSELGSYLINVFGNPLYNDNSTAAFSTVNAVNRAIFRSFVAYPVLTQWSSTRLFIDGSYQTFWASTSPGSMVVYAPYSTTSLANVNPNLAYYTNATIRFDAFAQTPQRLIIAEPSNGNSTRGIAEFNITASSQIYSVNTIMESGPVGNVYYFLYQNNNSPVLINNITISK